ncbi:MAG: hypothetical protein LBD93_10080 [Treponema sp.]|nr:hypothetical protein [Treponema sp.]
MFGKRLGSIGFCVLLFSGCYTMNNVRKDSLLSEQKAEGFLLMLLYINQPEGWQLGMIHRDRPRDYGPFPRPAVGFENLKPGENLLLIKLAEGKYTFKYLTRFFTYFELEDHILEIKPGVINYGGLLDIYIQGAGTIPRAEDIEYVYGDGYERGAALLAIAYPEVFLRYELVNTLSGEMQVYRNPQNYFR